MFMCSPGGEGEISTEDVECFIYGKHTLTYIKGIKLYADNLWVPKYFCLFYNHIALESNLEYRSILL